MKFSQLDYIKAIIGDDSYDGDESKLTKDHRDRIQDALKQALEIRKFEIELYWKRTQYFWAFLVTIYGSYFVVFSKSGEIDETQKTIILLGLATLGVFFSLGWHLVNRGSKFWQQNWEYHVDELEKYVHGPIYKTVIAKTNYGKKVFKGYWFSPVGAYPFSVSNVNCLLSGTISISSYILLAAEACKLIYGYQLSPIISGITFSVWLLLSSLIMLMFSKYSEGRMAKDYMANKEEKEQPVFLLRDKE